MIDLLSLTALTAPLPGGAVVAEHLGSLHPVEQVLTFVLAFGPFVVLGVVVAWRRRHEDPEQPDEPDEPGETRDEGDGRGPQERAEPAPQADR